MIDIAEEHGSFLLIRRESRYAVVERRNGRFYPMKPGERDGVETPGEIASVVTEKNWLPEDEARQLFKELCERGDRLAQTLR